MARMEDLPTELLEYVTGYLRRASDLAAFARTSRRIFDVVDPMLYKVARDKLSGRELWHPLRWAADNGRTGTVEKALIAGIDANMRFQANIDETTRDMQSFQIRVEAVDGNSIWDPPKWDPSEEWRPRDDDSDDDEPLGASRGFDFGTGLNMFDDEDLDEDSDVTEPTPGPYPQASAANMGHLFGGHDEDSSEGSEISNEDDEDASSSDMSEDVIGEFRAIHLAARGGHDDVVRILLDNGADIDVVSDQLCTCAPWLARVQTHAGIPGSWHSPFGWSPLHLAICHFHTSTAKYLLSRGASVQLGQSNEESHLTVTALHAAAATGQAELCRHLLDEGHVSDVDLLDSCGLTPFYHAYYNGHWKTTVSFLLERHANIDHLVGNDERNPEWFVTILYEACHFGRYEDAMRLVHLGANVNKGEYKDDVQTEWPLHAVLRPPREFEEPVRNPPLKLSTEADNSAQKRVELIETLLRQGANTEAESNTDGNTALHLAARLDNGPALRALLAAGANLESRNDSLEQALRRGEENLVRTLLDHGSMIDATDYDGETALHLVSRQKASIIDRRIIDRYKQEMVVRLLLDRGANESARNKPGMTPFHIAVTEGYLETSNILLRHRSAAQPFPQKDLARMLHEVTEYVPADLGALNLILDLDVDGFLYRTSTYLMAMIEERKYEFAAAYLERDKSAPPLTPKEKSTILHLSIEHGFLGLAKRMLGMKVSVNSFNEHGYTPLYAIASRLSNGDGRYSLAEALLDAGADIHMHCTVGESPPTTPLEMAVIRGNHALVELMLRRQPLRNDPQMALPPLAPRGVYLHAAARTVPSKRMFSLLIRSGVSVTELDANGDYPLTAFLKQLVDAPLRPRRLEGAEARAATDRVLSTIWYLWSKDVDINRRNKAGKSILSYLSALKLYSGRDTARASIARQLRRCITIVPARRQDRAQDDQTLEFRHGPLGLWTFDAPLDEGVARPSRH
ncbi:hypothetical protein SLS53_004756 [Cytospora paraplurivora]|uniref:Peptidase A2 domain-containing protein n=1 Tax=Cytospora paraplurivora TaxID=2898453 RepID=A0AAN9YF25_9PEZI